MTQPGIEPGHPRTLYPDDVIRDTIGQVGHPIYILYEILFIYHSLLTLRIYVLYEIYNIHIRKSNICDRPCEKGHIRAVAICSIRAF